MSYSIVTHTGAASGNSVLVTTPGVNTTTADLIVICVAYIRGFGTYNPIDSNSNTWTALTQPAGTLLQGQMYYCRNPTVGAGHTFSLGDNSTAISPSICIIAAAGSVASPLDQQNNNNALFGGSSIQTGSVTPGAANELLVSGVAWYTNAGGNGSVDSGFTLTNTITQASNACGCAMGYLIQGAASAVNPTWTTSDVTAPFEMTGTIGTFKAPASGPPATAYGAVIS